MYQDSCTPLIDSSFRPFAKSSEYFTNLGAGGVYTYLFASYSLLGAEVWYIGDLHGIITIPSIWKRCGLIHWTLFGPGSHGVPDGGATAMLLGASLSILGVARRFLIS